MSSDGTIGLFMERQRFLSKGVALAVVALAWGGTGWAALQIWREIGDDRLALLPAGLGLIAAVVVPFIFYRAELRVTLHPDRLEVVFPPFTRRSIPLSEIREAQVREYRPLLEYGGWGVRQGRSGRAYTVRGKEGVQLTLQDGQRVLVGSTRSQDLASALASAGCHIGSRGR